MREGLCDVCPEHRARTCGCAGPTEVRSGLGRSHGYIGDIHRVAGRYAEAEASYKASHEIRKRLYETYKDDATLRSNLAIQFARSFNNLAWLARHRGDLKAAVAWLGERGVRFTPGGIRKGASGHDVCFIHPKGGGETPVGGEGVLIELVQAPPDVVAAHRGPR